MQEGGLVSPEPSASDSPLQQTSSASPLLPTAESTDSDTPDGTFNFELLSPEFREAVGLDIPTLDFPEIISGFEFRDADGNIDFQAAYENFLSQQTQPIETQEQLDEVFDRFNSEVQQPILDAAEAYKNSIPDFNAKNSAYLQRMARLATPESLSEALKFKKRDTGEYALDKIVLNEEKDVQYNVPGLGMTNRAKIMADDLDDYSKYFTTSRTKSLLTALETGAPTYRKVVSEDGKLVDAPLAPTPVLTEEGEKWMATVIDPAALSLLEAEKANNRPRAIELKNKIDRLESADDLSAGQMMALRDLKREFAGLEKYLSDDLDFSEEDLNQARKSVWNTTARDKALANVALSYDEWKNFSSSGLTEVVSGKSEEELKKSYQEYLGDMEVEIYKDLLDDPSANLAASYFGEDGFKLFLDETDTALGERNSRFRDARISWKAGIVDLQGSIDAVALDLATSGPKYYTSAGMLGPTSAMPKAKSEAEAERLEQEYFAREIERRGEIKELLDQQTKYATAAKFIDKFGQAALVNEQTQLESFMDIKSQTRKDIEFVDYMLPAVQSLPQSSAAQVAGVGVGLLTGNPYAGAFTTAFVMQSLVTSKTYYNSYLDPRFDDLTESQRRLYSVAFGAAESAGEALDYLTMRMGTKLISGGVTGQGIKELFGRGVYSKFTYLGPGNKVTRTWAGFARDLTLGTAGALGLNVGGEYIAEGGTGMMQYILDRIVLGEPIDWSEAFDIAHHDGKIGIYAGLISGGSISSLQIAAAGIEAKMFEERFNARAQMLALAQYMRSGAMDGVESQQDHEELRKLQQKLADQKAGRITMSPQEVQDTRDNIGRLTDKAARENQRLADQFEKLRKEGRYDLIAELIALDNREMFLDWALSFDKRKIVIDGMGAARTEDGRLASGYGSRMDSQLQGITEKQKEKYRKELSEVRSRKRMARGFIEAGQDWNRVYIDEDGFIRGEELSRISSRAYLNTQTESAEDGFVLLADEEGNMVLNIDSATLAALPQEQQELLEEAAQYAVSAKGGARVVVHTTRESLERATGVRNAAYLEASEEQRLNGMQDEIHVVLEEGQAEQLRVDLVHEMGHFRFRDAVNDEASRKKMVAEITELANKRPGSFVNELYKAVQQAYSEKSIEDVEKELINHFVQAVAQGATVVGGRVLDADLSQITGGLERWGLADLFGTKKISSLDAVIIAQQFAREISKTSEFYGAFTRQDFENLIKSKNDQKEMDQKAFSPNEEGNTNDSIVAMENRSLSGKSNFLQNTTIQYYQDFTDVSVRGTVQDSRTRFKEITVKDYNHFRNFYIKMTGNGSVARNMYNMTYQKDGKSYNLRPPRLRTDRQGNLVEMQAPVMEGFKARQIRIAEQNLQARRQGFKVLEEKTRVLMGEFRNSVAYGMTSHHSFYPIELLRQESESFRFTDLSVNERIAATDHAIANVQALNRSNITKDQLKERGKWLSIEDNQDIFNIAAGKYQTVHEKIDILTEGAQELGMRAWEMFPFGSAPREDRHSSFGLATNEELDSALSFLRNARAGSKFEGGMRSAQQALENKDLPDVKMGERSPEKRGVSKNDLKLIDPAFLSPSLHQGMMGIYDPNYLNNVLVTAHNLDRTTEGPVSFFMRAFGEETPSIKFSSANNKVSGLMGGPIGPARVKAKHGLGLVHSNTNAESSKEIYRNALRAIEMEKEYALLFRVLAPENSFNNPLVMSILVDALIQYANSSEQANERVRKVLEAYMSNSYYAETFGESLTEEEIASFIPLELRDDVVEGIMQYSIKETVWESLSFFMNTVFNPIEGVTEYGKVISIASNGVVPLLRRLQDVSGEIGFGDRGAFVSKMLQSRGGVSNGGFITKQEFIDAINDPLFKNAESGDVVAVSAVDLKNVKLSSDITKGFKKGSVDINRVAYKYGVIGSKDFKVLQKFYPPEAINIPFEARARLTELQTLESAGVSSNALLSRRLGGRVYIDGGDSWTASTATPYGAALQRAALRFQDKYSDVLLLQQDVEVFRGSKVPQSQDFEMAMDTFYGIVRNDLETIEGFLEDINRKRASFGITSNQLSDYLYARHAIERNKFIFDRTNGLNEAGSGMTNERAEELLNKLESAEMRILANDVYKVIEYTRKFMVDGGLETRSVVDEWRNRFENYVPLNGLAVDEMDEATSHYPTGGAGMAIYGPSVKKAMGRGSETGANILGNVIMQAMATAQRARKDQAMLKLYRLIENNPNSDVWSVHGPKNPIVSMGKKLSAQQAKARQDVVPIRINGKQHFIKFKDASHAQALNGMTVEKLDATSRTMAKYTGFLRNSYTVYNPAFFLTNFARDFHSALYNAAAEIEREGGILEGYGLSTKEFNKRLMRTTMTSLGMLLKSAHGGDMSAEMQQYMEEWMASGGRTGWSYSDTLNKLVAELGDKTVDRSKAGEVVANIWGKSGGAVLSYVESINEAFENSVRLAAYIEVRRAGMTKERAAQMSKNITVNFNKSGTLTPSINSYFLFFNAAIQGLSRFNRTYGTLKAEVNEKGEKRGAMGRLPAPIKIAMGVIMLEYAKTIINILVSAVDDDDELYYNKIPDYRKQRSSIVMLGPKDPLMIPLPYGTNIFSNIGMVLAEMTLGERSPESAAAFLALSAHASFSPISFGQGDNLVSTAVSTALPSALKPGAEVAFNSTYFGGKVYQKQYPFGTETPEYTLAFRSPEFAVEFAQYLNEMSGGREKISGGINVNPDPYYYLLISLTGGAGKFASDAIDITYTGSQIVKNAINESSNNKGFLEALRDTEKPILKRSDVPILKILYGEASRFFDYDLFEENRTQVKQFEAQAKAYAEGEDVTLEGLNFAGINKLSKDLKQAEDMLSEIRSFKKQLRQGDEIDYIKKMNMLHYLEEEERKAIMYFNARYYDLRGKYVDPKPQGLIPTETVKQALGIYGEE